MMDALKCCKQHDRLVTAKDMEKLTSFKVSEIIDAANFFFLKRVTAPETQRLSNSFQGTFIT